MNIEKLVKFFGLSDNEVSQNLVSKSCNTDISALNEIYKTLKLKKSELNNIKDQTFKLESKIAGLKFEYFSTLKDNQILAINLSGLLGENDQLKRKHGRAQIDENTELHELINRWLFIFRK